MKNNKLPSQRPLFYMKGEVAHLVDKIHNTRLSTLRKVPPEMSQKFLELAKVLENSETVSYEVINSIEEMIAYIDDVSDDLVGSIYEKFLCITLVPLSVYFGKNTPSSKRTWRICLA